MAALWQRLRAKLAGSTEEPAEVAREETLASPGPLFRGTTWWGRVRATRDFLDAVEVRVRNHNRRIHSTATLRLYDGDELMRESRRDTQELNDGEWAVFPFESVRESENRTYRVSIETDAEYEAIEAVDARPREFASLARLLDPLLFREGDPPPVPDYLERYLDRHVYQCVNLRRYFFPRLAHLADAFGRTGAGVERVLAIGVGTGYQEAFLAGRIPDLDLLATDVERQIVDFPMPNLRFETLDLLAEPGPERYDFVFSIECLEHVEDYRRAFRNHAARVAPGKFLYISVPYASREEQRDEALRRIAWEEFEHYTPGFAFEDLEELFAENDLEVVHASNMFFANVMLPVRAIVEAIDAGTLEAGAEAIARLELLDVCDRRVESCREAEGIRFLGRKKG